MFDFNDPEVRSAIIDLSKNTDSPVAIVPVPVQNGEHVDGDYEFSADDVIGEIDSSITVDAVNQRIQDYRWMGIRAERDRRLKETDIWALPDRTMTQAQIDYRQALRDITTQSDTSNIIWPTKPE